MLSQPSSLKERNDPSASPLPCFWFWLHNKFCPWQPKLSISIVVAGLAIYWALPPNARCLNCQLSPATETKASQYSIMHNFLNCGDGHFFEMLTKECFILVMSKQKMVNWSANLMGSETRLQPLSSGPHLWYQKSKWKWTSLPPRIP